MAAWQSKTTVIRIPLNLTYLRALLGTLFYSFLKGAHTPQGEVQRGCELFLPEEIPIPYLLKKRVRTSLSHVWDNPSMLQLDPSDPRNWLSPCIRLSGSLAYPCQRLQ